MKYIYKFVNWEIEDFEKVKNDKLVCIMNKLENKKKLTRQEKNICLNYGHYHDCMGYRYNFSEYMKTFIVKIRHCGWQEYKHFDKTSLRNYLHSKYISDYQILKIVEI